MDVVVHPRYGHLLRSPVGLHNAAFRKCSAVVSLKLHLMPCTLRALTGFQNRRYAKVPSLVRTCKPPALPRRFASYVQSPVALVICWLCGIGQALCALVYSAAYGHAFCICPRPPLRLACFAASPMWSARPPPKGAPAEPRQGTPLPLYLAFEKRGRFTCQTAGPFWS